MLTYFLVVNLHVHVHVHVVNIRVLCYSCKFALVWTAIQMIASGPEQDASKIIVFTVICSLSVW